jgi:hypothetical protein
MPYGNPQSVGLTGGSAGIEAGELSGRNFVNALLNSELLTDPVTWTFVGAGTVGAVTPLADLPVGGNLVFRVTDTDAVVASAIEQVALQPLASAADRPIIFSFYLIPEAYVQTRSRAVARLDLLNGNNVIFSVDFNPQNGQVLATAFSSTEPGFASAETTNLVQAFIGQNGVSGIRFNLIIFARGLMGLSSVTSCTLQLFPDVDDPTQVGRFIDVTACQIAIPTGTISTPDFGLAPYRPTWQTAQFAQASKIAQNALDVGFHSSAVVDPYLIDLYADLGTIKTVTLAGQDFTLPALDPTISDGWWMGIGSVGSLSFDIVIPAGYSLELGGGVTVAGPATHTVLDATVNYWMLIGGAASGVWQLYKWLQN